MSGAGPASSAARSFTDPLSNLVFLPSVDVGKHIRQIHEADLPPESLPAFLHEATHHWCSYSLLGVAELLLFFQARRFAMRRSRRTGDDDGAVLDAVARYEFTQGLMGPLSEGLALFAEHDACVGNAETISDPALLTAMLYANGLAIRGGPNFKKLPLVLAGSRITAAHIRRKADLLVQPLDFADGGYLAGYLLVKTLWHANLFEHKCAKFLDTDFFLQFARAFFFDDWGMVACLLDGSRSDLGGMDSMDPIARRFQLRLRAMVRGPDRCEEAERFESTGKDGRRSTLELRTELAQLRLAYYDICENEELSDLGKRRLKTLFDELFGSWPTDPIERRLVELDLQVLSLINTITLAHGEFQAHRDGAMLRFSGRDTGDFSLPGPEVLEDGWKGALTLDAIASLRPIGVFFVISADKKVIATHSISQGADSSWLETPLSSMQNRSALAQYTRRLVGVLEDEILQRVRQHTRDELERMLPKIYLPRALARVPDRLLERVTELAREDGLFHLLGNDLRRVKDCAALSLSAPFKMDPGAVHSWQDGDMISTLRNLNATLEPVLGFVPFFEREGKLLMSFI